MTETLHRPTDSAAEVSSALSEQLGLAPGLLGAAVFEMAQAAGERYSVKDATTGRYLHASAEMAELFGCSLQQMLGRVDADLIDAAAWVPLRAADQLAATREAAHTHVHRIDLGGGVREFRVTRLCLRAAEGGAPRGLLSVWTELTEQRRLERQLQQALRQLEQHAEADAARESAAQTALPAPEMSLRARFDDQLRREIDLSNREHREFALVSVAIDPLDEARIPQADLARERVQQTVSRLLRSNTRAMDAACRLDDSRFAILLSGVGLATAHARIESLRRECATEIVAVDGHDLRFTVSMGVASYPHTAQDREALIAASEKALAQAQRRGGNHVALASIRFEPV